MRRLTLLVGRPSSTRLLPPAVRRWFFATVWFLMLSLAIGSLVATALQVQVVASLEYWRWVVFACTSFVGLSFFCLACPAAAAAISAAKRRRLLASGVVPDSTAGAARVTSSILNPGVFHGLYAGTNLLVFHILFYSVYASRLRAGEETARWIVWNLLLLHVLVAVEYCLRHALLSVLTLVHIARHGHNLIDVAFRLCAFSRLNAPALHCKPAKQGAGKSARDTVRWNLSDLPVYPPRVCPAEAYADSNETHTQTAVVGDSRLGESLAAAQFAAPCEPWAASTFHADTAGGISTWQHGGTSTRDTPQTLSNARLTAGPTHDRPTNKLTISTAPTDHSDSPIYEGAAPAGNSGTHTYSHGTSAGQRDHTVALGSPRLLSFSGAPSDTALPAAPEVRVASAGGRAGVSRVGDRQAAGRTPSQASRPDCAVACANEGRATGDLRSAGRRSAGQPSTPSSLTEEQAKNLPPPSAASNSRAPEVYYIATPKACRTVSLGADLRMRSSSLTALPPASSAATEVRRGVTFNSQAEQCTARAAGEDCGRAGTRTAHLNAQGHAQRQADSSRFQGGGSNADGHQTPPSTPAFPQCAEKTGESTPPFEALHSFRSGGRPPVHSRGGVDSLGGASGPARLRPQASHYSCPPDADDDEQQRASGPPMPASSAASNAGVSAAAPQPPTSYRASPSTMLPHGSLSPLASGPSYFGELVGASREARPTTVGQTMTGENDAQLSKGVMALPGSPYGYETQSSSSSPQLSPSTALSRLWADLSVGDSAPASPQFSEPGGWQLPAHGSTPLLDPIPSSASPFASSAALPATGAPSLDAAANCARSSAAVSEHELTPSSSFRPTPVLGLEPPSRRRVAPAAGDCTGALWSGSAGEASAGAPGLVGRGLTVSLSRRMSACVSLTSTRERTPAGGESPGSDGRASWCQSPMGGSASSSCPSSASSSSLCDASLEEERGLAASTSDARSDSSPLSVASHPLHSDDFPSARAHPTGLLRDTAGAAKDAPGVASYAFAGPHKMSTAFPQRSADSATWRQHGLLFPYRLWELLVNWHPRVWLGGQLVALGSRAHTVRCALLLHEEMQQESLPVCNCIRDCRETPAEAFGHSCGDSDVEEHSAAATRDDAFGDYDDASRRSSRRIHKRAPTPRRHRRAHSSASRAMHSPHRSSAPAGNLSNQDDHTVDVDTQAPSHLESNVYDYEEDGEHSFSRLASAADTRDERDRMTDSDSGAFEDSRSAATNPDDLEAADGRAGATPGPVFVPKLERSAVGSRSYESTGSPRTQRTWTTNTRASEDAPPAGRSPTSSYSPSAGAHRSLCFRGTPPPNPQHTHLREVLAQQHQDAANPVSVNSSSDSSIPQPGPHLAVPAMSNQLLQPVLPYPYNIPMAAYPPYPQHPMFLPTSQSGLPQQYPVPGPADTVGMAHLYPYSRMYGAMPVYPPSQGDVDGGNSAASSNAAAQPSDAAMLHAVQWLTPSNLHGGKADDPRPVPPPSPSLRLVRKLLPQKSAASLVAAARHLNPLRSVSRIENDQAKARQDEALVSAGFMPASPAGPIPSSPAAPMPPSPACLGPANASAPPPAGGAPVRVEPRAFQTAGLHQASHPDLSADIDAASLCRFMPSTNAVALLKRTACDSAGGASALSQTGLALALLELRRDAKKIKAEQEVLGHAHRCLHNCVFAMLMSLIVCIGLTLFGVVWWLSLLVWLVCFLSFVLLLFGCRQLPSPSSFFFVTWHRSFGPGDFVQLEGRAELLQCLDIRLSASTFRTCATDSGPNETAETVVVPNHKLAKLSIHKLPRQPAVVSFTLKLAGKNSLAAVRTLRADVRYLCQASNQWIQGQGNNAVYIQDAHQDGSLTVRRGFLTAHKNDSLDLSNRKATHSSIHLHYLHSPR
eukprot:GHVT01020157.1.p1 GENE.GHVT01020157.1~~GHVT01020157.1.p1  ORF type:complete len:2103 (+),score=504.51 GHVT01020157.1:654-6311(+)